MVGTAPTEWKFIHLGEKFVELNKNGINMINLPTKIHIYRNSCMFDTLSEYQSKIANSEKFKSPKTPSLIFLRLGWERDKNRGKECKTI